MMYVLLSRGVKALIVSPKTPLRNASLPMQKFSTAKILGKYYVVLGRGGFLHVHVMPLISWTLYTFHHSRNAFIMGKRMEERN
jgi:hypothetical protein